MKYKLIILLFNVFMLFSFLTLFFMPIIIFEASFVAEFWRNNWFLPIVFFITILIVNFFFIFNWSIINYTKTGNWDGVVSVLENRIYEKRIITYSNTRLLVYAYFLLGKEDKIKSLEKYLKDRKKTIYNRTFLMFSCANLISDSTDDLIAYFDEAVNNEALKGKEWIFINYAFVLISKREFDKALAVLEKMETVKNNPVLELTRLYFMHIASRIRAQKDIELLKEDFIKRISIEEFEKQFNIEKGDIHILFLSKIINQAKEWAY